MTITPLKINSNQNVLTDFIESLETSLDEIYKQNSNEDIAKQMFTVVHKQGTQFFDQQMYKSPPQFICLLISTFPELLTAQINREDIPTDNDSDICIYDHLCTFFMNMLIDNAISQGVEAGVFSESENSINLTPNCFANPNEKVS